MNTQAIRTAIIRKARIAEMGRDDGGLAGFPEALAVGATEVASPSWGIAGSAAQASSPYIPTEFGTADPFTVHVGSAANLGVSMGAGIPTPYDTGLELNNDYYQTVTNQPEIFPATDDFWVEALLESTDLAGTYELFDANDGAHRWNFEFASNRIRMRMNDGVIGLKYIDFGTGTLTANTVYYVAVAGNRSVATGWKCWVPQIDDTGPLATVGSAASIFNTIGSVSPTSAFVLGATTAGAFRYVERLSMLRLYKQASIFDDGTWLADCLAAAKSRAQAMGVYAP